MTLKRSFVESEKTSRFNWADNGATQVLVVNEDKPNKYGELRGYRILPYTGTAHLTVKDSSNMVNAAHWAEYDVQITKQKDTEPKSAHPYNSQDVNDPPVNFAKFFNDEKLRKEDLVFWLNLGMHHVPHTGNAFLFFSFLFQCQPPVEAELMQAKQAISPTRSSQQPTQASSSCRAITSWAT
jgi:primary-amine oxidase